MSDFDDLFFHAEELNPISANDLLNKEIPELKFLVKDLCPAGLGVLAAPPKFYKSFLALQLCVALSTGKDFLGRPTERTGCLYFDLESSNRRPQNRLKAMGIDNLDGVQFVTQEEMPKKDHGMITLANGFSDTLENYLTKNPKIGFIVIDVFKKIRTEVKKTQSLYDHDYADIEKLQAIAGNKNVTILLLHHTRKLADANDPFNNMSGSSGLLGAVDFCWLISKNKRNDQQATLSITGRDIESAELTVEFDQKNLEWKFIGTAEDIQAQRELDEYNSSAITKVIRQLVNQNGQWTGTVSEIIHASRYTDNQIHQPPQQVGKAVQKYTPLLYSIDEIKTNCYRGERARYYTFTKK